MAAYCGAKHSAFRKVFVAIRLISPPRTGIPDSPSGRGSPECCSELSFFEAASSVRFYLEVGRNETTLPFSHLLETRVFATCSSERYR